MQASDTSDSSIAELSAPRTATVTLWGAAAVGGFWASATLLLAAKEAGRLAPDPLAVFATALGLFYFALGLGALALHRTRLPIFGTYLFLSFGASLVAAISPAALYSLWVGGRLLPALGALSFILGFTTGGGARLIETLGRELGSAPSWPAARLGLAAGAAAAALKIEGSFFLFRATGWLAAAHALVLLALVVIHRERLPRSAKAWMAIGAAVCTVGLLFAANGEEYYRVLQSIYFP